MYSTVNGNWLTTDSSEKRQSCFSNLVWSSYMHPRAHPMYNVYTFQWASTLLPDNAMNRVFKTFYQILVGFLDIGLVLLDTKLLAPDNKKMSIEESECEERECWTWVGTCATSVCRAWERTQREDRTGSHLGNRSLRSTCWEAVLKTWTDGNYCQYALRETVSNKPVCLLEIGYVSQSNDALTDKTQRVKRDPESVPVKCLSLWRVASERGRDSCFQF